MNALALRLSLCVKNLLSFVVFSGKWRDVDMHGLIFVTWEKYLRDRFGDELLNRYRSTLGETAASSPLVSRIYDDATLLSGVDAAHKLTRMPVDSLLWEYGRYFIINGLTSHLCAHILTRVHSGYDLLLVMRNAHAQMRRVPGDITPPLFAYEAISASPRKITLVYDSPRKLCALLWGAIEGCAERYGERVQIIEHSCMKRGAPICRFELHFSTPMVQPRERLETPEQIAQRKNQHQLANLLLSVLPNDDGVMLTEVQKLLQPWQLHPNQLRPRALLEALQHLQHAGLLASTANQPGDDLTHRRYWRAPTRDRSNSMEESRSVQSQENNNDKRAENERVSTKRNLAAGDVLVHSGPSRFAHILKFW
jgi:hypothetical protein